MQVKGEEKQSFLFKKKTYDWEAGLIPVKLEKVTKFTQF